MKKLLLFLYLILPLFLWAQPDSAAILADSIPKERVTVFRHLQQDSILHLHFKTKIKGLKKFEDDPEKHPAKLTLGNTALEKKKWKIKLEQRGKLRRDICLYKPQRIKFSKKQLTKRGLIPRRNVKMVMRCHGGKSSDRLVLKEYLVYQLYNILTDKSYQVQLIQATFEDSLKSKDNFESYGFLIEPTKELGLRNWASISESQGKTPSDMGEKTYLLMSIFQYMVGNTDWNIEKAHNLKFLKAPADNLYTPIPYDFDFTGFVNAAYAEPNVALPIDDVTVRLFMGAYQKEALLKETLQLFHDKKEEMKKLVLDFPYLSEKERKNSWAYLEEFFKKTANLKHYQRLFPKKTVYQDIMELEKRKAN